MKQSVAIKILDQTSLETAQKYWIELEKRVENVPLVCTWDWVSTWIKHFGDIVPYWFCVGFVDDNVVGIAMVTNETTRWLPFPVNAYHLGTQGEPLKDWIHMVNNNVLTLEPYYEEYVRSLTTTIMENFTWEEFLFDDTDKDFSETVLKHISGRNMSIHRVVESCYFVNLKKIRDEKKTVMESFTRDTRYQIKRNLKEFNDLTVEYAETLHQAVSIFKELRELQEASFQKKGKRSPFLSERFTKFHTETIKKLLPKQNVILFRVRSKKFGTLGCFYLFRDNDIAFGYLCGLQDFSSYPIQTINPKRLKPGFVLHALCMEACLKRGVNEYNFSVGNEPYKKEFATEIREMVTLKLQKNMKAKIRETLFETYIRIEEERRFSALLKPIYGVYRILNR